MGVKIGDLSLSSFRGDMEGDDEGDGGDAEADEDDDEDTIVNPGMTVFVPTPSRRRRWG